MSNDSNWLVALVTFIWLTLIIGTIKLAWHLAFGIGKWTYHTLAPVFSSKAAHHENMNR
ncbi:hypothetical protein ACNAN0_10340 [Agrilactobacillus fermenti]|uniref:hypothetical protein n=1 Tax=Agrilactobacillus fermenti TaxID=2586909 RepID=UPI001E5EFCB0|nr:hypothetical protein [Agrilactobacillus fermenti]MCD2256822.1 hypothetical protein [Agrilactobacillus fermenti]